jgi:hypothetical protein
MAHDDVDLDRERQLMDDLFRSIIHSHVPLAVGAAITFHQVHGNTRAIVNRQDYDDALNIAAAALSRLISIYVVDGSPEGHTVLAVDLTKQHFARGATALRSPDGSTQQDLTVLRGEMLSAISLIKRAGLPFAFALPATTKAVAVRETPEQDSFEPDQTP